MLTIRLPVEVRKTIGAACLRAGVRETGGMLFGEHVGENDFRVVEATIEGTGSFAGFVRVLVDGFAKLEGFFSRTKRDYGRFNYLGEWHSHPSFELHPSATDDRTMLDIVEDPSTGARFAVSLIVKTANGTLQAEAFVYFPREPREAARVLFENC